MLLRPGRLPVFNLTGLDMTTQWIGPDDSLELNDIGFLIEKSNPVNGGWERWELRDTPPHTNQSNMPRLYGWCGSYNDVSTNGHGVGKVIRVAKNGRCLIQVLEGDAQQAALDELGYPDLTAED